MKKSLLILFVIILAINFGTQAADFSAVYNGKTIYYNITSSTSPLGVAVTYQGNSYDSYPNEYSGLIIIPDSVQYNGNYYKVTSFGINAFASCILLTSIIIPNSVTSIDFNSFKNCSGLNSITIPNSITSISSGAFEDCSGLTSVTIPNSVTSIGNYAFAGCSGLTSVTIPNSVTSISNGVFYDCSGLTSVTIPNSVTSIGNYAFAGCSGLTSVTIPNSVTSISNGVFYDCSGLTSVTIPNSITSIGNEAFSYCFGLTSVTIPNSVTSIGISAFEDCSGLTSVTIPNSVTSIGISAFEDCSGLTSITIPSSVTSIGNYAFYNCSGLTSITSKAINPPAVQGNSFFGVTKTIPFYVPCNSLTIYQLAEFWSDFVNYKCDPISLEDEIKINISTKIYPNPTYGNIKLEVEGLNSEADVLVYDMIGRVIQRYTINKVNKILDINLSTYAKGVYSIRIVNERINQTKKLVVQ